MKQTGLFSAAIAAATISACSGAIAQSIPMPAMLSTKLLQRENKLDRTSLTWQINQERSIQGAPAKFVPGILRNAEITAKTEARRDGLTNKSDVDILVKSRVEAIRAFTKPHTVSFTNTWQFSRDNRTVLVEGKVDAVGYPATLAQSFYGEGVGLNFVQSLSQKPLVRIWGSSVGDATRTSMRSQDGLNISPEDQVMLTGLNPLDMYGAKWKLITSTEKVWVIEATDQAQSVAPIKVQVTLSRIYGGAPIELDMKGPSWSATYRAEKFGLQNGTWLCSKVIYNEQWPGIQTKKTWSFERATAIKRLSIASATIPNGTDVIDSRRNPEITYAWNGHILSSDELKSLDKLRHPGESTPDPGKTSSANFSPFIGGMLCIVGGVWMFKRRGQA